MPVSIPCFATASAATRRTPAICQKIFLTSAPKNAIMIARREERMSPRRKRLPRHDEGYLRRCKKCGNTSLGCILFLMRKLQYRGFCDICDYIFDPNCPKVSGHQGVVSSTCQTCREKETARWGKPTVKNVSVRHFIPKGWHSAMAASSLSHWPALSAANSTSSRRKTPWRRSTSGW